ncbi:MAG: hypothetical protein U1E36_03635 [Rickettsiales bacterium]
MTTLYYKNTGGGLVNGIEHDAATSTGKVLLTMAANPTEVAEKLSDRGIKCRANAGIYQNGSAHLHVDVEDTSLLDLQDAIVMSGLTANTKGDLWTPGVEVNHAAPDSWAADIKAGQPKGWGIST